MFAQPEQANIISLEAEVPVHRTESLGLKCLGDKPLLVPQLSTDSVFSRDESETIDEYPEPTPSIPIGIRRVKQDDSELSSSAPSEQGIRIVNTLLVYPHNPIRMSESATPPLEVPSMSSLPDRLACEAMAAAMTDSVLNDEAEQIKTNILYQKIVDSQPTARDFRGRSDFFRFVLFTLYTYFDP